MDLRVTVLPAGSHAADFLRLPHPRTGRACLYLPYTPISPASTLSEAGLPTPLPSPSGSSSAAACDGLLELQNVQPPADARRSWFVGQTVVSDGRMNLLTPCDPLFLLIPLLEAVQSTNTRSLPYQDLFETAAEAHVFTQATEDAEVRAVGHDAIRFGELDCVKSLVERICQVEAAAQDIQTYRLSMVKAVDLLKAKVERLANEVNYAGHLPSLRRALGKQGVGESSSIAPSIRQLARTKVALELIGNYLPGHVDDHLRAEYRFDALDDYVASHTTALGTPEAEDDDWQDVDPRKMNMGKAKGGGAAALKRKASKNNVNHATQRLKKVDVRRNHKLSNYFKPAGPA